MKLLTPSQAITTDAVRSPSGRSVRTPVTRPADRREESCSRPVTVVLHSNVAPAATAWSASQRSKSGRNAVAPLYGGAAQASLRKSIDTAFVSVSTIVDRRVTQRWIGTSVHHWGISSSRMRGYTTPPYMFLLPGYGPSSSISVRKPPRPASIAAHEPAGPAPTITTSKSVSATLPARLER